MNIEIVDRLNQIEIQEQVRHSLLVCLYFCLLWNCVFYGFVCL